MFRTCDGVNRRDVVRAGVLGPMGLGLAELFAARDASAKSPGGTVPPAERNCIFIFLAGGPSQYETFDLKPNAAAEIRGEFKPIPSSISGLDVAEHLPKLAKSAHRMSIIRSLTHTNAGHGGGAHYMCTGKHPTPLFKETTTRPNNEHPFPGAVVTRERGARKGIPPFVSLPMLLTYGGPAFLGPEYMPFVIESDPASPGFSVRDLAAAPGVGESRAAARRTLRGVFEEENKAALKKASSRVEALNTFYQKAFDLVTSPAARSAFDIHRESTAVRDSYGRHTFGQSLLMGRRLIEAGCRFVSIDHGGWDNHTTIFQTLKDDLLPQVDSGLTSLLKDLDERGMLDSTMVVVMGEFGRTSRVNKDAGRDHWPQSQSVVITGGGIKRGQVIGSTDASGEYPVERPVSPEELMATIYTALGVDYQQIVYTPLGRPVPIVADASPVQELL